ncbi:MAG TPA: hypothetical protein VIJ95_12280 [Hanamia sp.]
MPSISLANDINGFASFRKPTSFVQAAGMFIKFVTGKPAKDQKIFIILVQNNSL